MSTSSTLDALAITAEGVTKTFEPGAGVHDVDLTVERGSIVGLIGPSGSGKTTAVRLLTGLLAPDSGRLSVLGQNPLSFDAETRRRLGYLPQETVLYPTLSIEENLAFVAAMHGLSGKQRRQRVKEVLEGVGLADTAHRRLVDSSGGMKRRAGLAAALVHGPDLVFLDEPTAGLDPILRQSVWAGFGDLRSAGATLVVTTQYVGEAAMCDEIVLLSDGGVAAKGSPEALRRDAYGGEIIDVRFERSASRDTIQVVADRIGATSFRGTGLGEVEFVVPDAGTATAALHRAAAEADLTIVEIERRYPEFDDVFVRIVDRHRAENGVTV